jgi:hypothetical protein
MQKDSIWFVAFALVIVIVVAVAVAYMIIVNLPPKGMALAAAVAIVMLFPAWLCGAWVGRWVGRTEFRGFRDGLGQSLSTVERAAAIRPGGSKEVKEVVQPADVPFELPRIQVLSDGGSNREINL